MSSTTEPAYHWLKQISPAILQWDQVPLYGAAPEFPWQEMSESLAQLFQLQSFQINHKETDWRNANELATGLGGEPATLQIGISDVEGSLFWVMGKSDLTHLMEILLDRPPEDFIPLDADFFRGFYHFIAATSLNALSQLPFGKNLNPGILENNVLPTEACLCQEIEINLSAPKGDRVVKGRLIIPHEALNSWKQRYADRSLSTALKPPLADKLQVPVHLEIGRTKLSQKEWGAIIPGDFLTLEQCSYDVEAAKGRVMMTVNGVPMFRAKLKAGNIKILEFPMYHEAPMNNDSLEGEQHDDLGEFEEELEEEHETEEEHEEEAPEALEEEAEEKPEKTAQATLVDTSKESKIKPSEIPLNIVVEVGRIQMSVQKLMELEPGNTLELDIHPENGVDLVVNGRRIGKGELLRVGDNLGVRILDIG